MQPLPLRLLSEASRRGCTGAKPLPGGAVAAVLFNRNGSTRGCANPDKQTIELPCDDDPALVEAGQQEIVLEFASLPSSWLGLGDDSAAAGGGTVKCSVADIFPPSPSNASGPAHEKDLGSFSGSYRATVPPHGVNFVRVSGCSAESVPSKTSSHFFKGVGSPHKSHVKHDDKENLDTAAGCAIIEQANVVAGTHGLGGDGSTSTVKFLGTFQAPQQCEAACSANSTATDPCRSWAFYYPDSPSGAYASACYGRHDDVWSPRVGIPLDQNHVCTAKSCNYPPLPPYPPPPRPSPAPPAPPVPLPPLDPLPQRAPAPVDPERHPVLYLGGVDDNGASSSNYSLVCKFQAVAIINSYLLCQTFFLSVAFPIDLLLWTGTAGRLARTPATSRAPTTRQSTSTSPNRAARCSSSAPEP